MLFKNLMLFFNLIRLQGLNKIHEIKGSNNQIGLLVPADIEDGVPTIVDD